jgi:hypothetical protein
MEERGEDGQGYTDDGSVARVVVVADRQSEVIERGQWVAVLGLESTEDNHQEGFVVAVTAVLSERATSIAIVVSAPRRPDYRDTTLTLAIALGDVPEWCNATWATSGSRRPAIVMDIWIVRRREW